MNEHDDQPTATFAKWKRTTNELMLADYGIDVDDAGIDDNRLREHWKTKQASNEFVEWFARKYDLTPISEWGWYPPRG